MIQIKIMILMTILIFSALFANFAYAEPGTPITQGYAGEISEMQFLTGENKLVQNLKSANGLSDIFNVLFQTVIALGAIWAVVSLAYWGAKYALWNSVTGKAAALEHMTPILTGLVALLGTYILFKQINPNLINSLDLKIDKQTTAKMTDMQQKAYQIKNAQEQRQEQIKQQSHVFTTKTFNFDNLKEDQTAIDSVTRVTRDLKKEQFCENKYANNKIECKKFLINLESCVDDVLHNRNTVAGACANVRAQADNYPEVIQKIKEKYQEEIRGGITDID